MTIMIKDFTSLLASHARQRPEAIALYDENEPVSFAQLEAQAMRLASLLLEHGAKRGDRLALWLPTCTAWLAAFFACARLGITVVAVNTRFRSNEVGDLISRGGCQWLLLWPTFKALPFEQILQDIPQDLLKPLKGIVVIGGWTHAPALPGVRHIAYEAQADTGPLAGLPHPDGKAAALVYTTSGTTSQAKLVLHDQQTLLGHGVAVAHRFDMRADDVLLLGAPLCGAFGFSGALGALAAGAAMVSSPVLSPEQCALQTNRFGATHIFANNELLSRMLDHGTAVQGEPAFPTLRLAGFASFAPSLGDFVERAEQAGMRLVGLYGSSELQALVASQDAQAPLAERQQPGGRLTAADARVRARDTESGQVLPHGAVGEIEIKAPSLMQGYLGNASATAQAIDAQGYFRTGDLGHTVSDQSFVFHARRGDFLRLGGFLVNPQEIQQFIESLPGVASCQVVGATHAGKAVPVAFVIAASGMRLAEAQIIAACRGQLAGFKVPRCVEIVTAFPVVESANSNKIQRGALQKIAQARLDRIN